ncbi:phytase [Pedobacter sp. SYSU D00535]|uniref:phytase n=1 Tax=Pedobacter sp. SYSU D00535 TaxID=2810308 RepID=UPI001F60CBD0|nr:phytase [Pedobacter sp. SYSU D00535]
MKPEYQFPAFYAFIMFRTSLFLIASISLFACSTKRSIAPNALKPTVISQQVEFDTDDPAIWINKADPAKSLVIGTDKETNGGIYAFDLQGKIVNKVTGIQRPNNVDVAYNFKVGGKTVDIAVATERETDKIRVFSLPDLRPLDNGGIEVFGGETDRSPMGIALYTRPSDQAVFAIVGRKFGPEDNYLFQYQLQEENGVVGASLVRRFGKFSRKKEIESIAVDNELGFVYFSDEGSGVHKYYADPLKGNEELAFFGGKDFKSDIEGISIYKTGDKTGYLLISNQQANSFNVYPREGSGSNIHAHHRITEIPFSTLESDGSEVTNVNLGPAFPKGLFVAMSNGKVFHYYDWRLIESRILEPLNKK